MRRARLYAIIPDASDWTRLLLILTRTQLRRPFGRLKHVSLSWKDFREQDTMNFFSGSL